jgi:hypothetical protein
MKKMFAKRGLTMLLASFFLFGLTMLTATSAGAQDISNWKQSDQAQLDLGVAVKDLHAQIQTLSGTPLNNAKAKVYYYKEMIQIIGSGTPVPSAIQGALHIFDNPGSMTFGKPDDVVVDAALRTSLVQDATNLLK